MSGPEVPKTSRVQYLLPQRDRCGIQQRGTVLESDHVTGLHVFQVCNQASVTELVPLTRWESRSA